MPKIKTQHKHKHYSKLTPYLRNKCRAKPNELRESASFTTDPTTSNNVYPAAWADPAVLSQTNAYHITRKFSLPLELETLVEKHSDQKIRVLANRNENYVAVVTPSVTSVYFYNEELDANQFINLSTDSLFIKGNAPFFNTFESGSKMGAVAISTKGQVHYWMDITVDTRIHYQIQLISQHEHITAVKLINKDQIIIGSSTGEIYYLQIQENEVTASTFYKHSGIVHYIAGIFSRKSLPSKTEIEKPSTAGPILNINVIGNDLYLVNSKYIALWNIRPDDEVEFVSRIFVNEEVIASVALHIPPNVSEDYIKSEIVDMSVISKEEIVVLASYSVPDMGDYVQYAIVTFSLKQQENTENEDDKNSNEIKTVLCVKHTASIPYSTIPSTLENLPRLSITGALAFVTFDKNVVAVSLDRKSVFEESFVLRSKDDHVLFTEIIETEKEDTANIYTLKSGIIEFKIDTDKIQESRATGNIYAGVVDDVMERDTLVFKSKLEQAVFFGAAEMLPVQFPLRIEQEDVSSAADSLLNDIESKICPFLPSTMTTDLYIESRWKFTSRVFTVLRDNDLHNFLSKEKRVKMFNHAECYYLAIILWELYLGFENDEATQKYWIASIVPRDESENWLEIENPQIATLLRDSAFDIVDFIGNITSNLDNGLQANESKEEDQIKLLNTTNELVLRATRKSKAFEERYLPVYNLVNDCDIVISVQFCDIILSLCNYNVLFLQNVTQNNTKEPLGLGLIKQSLVELAMLLLQILSEAVNSNNGNTEDKQATYQTVRKSVIEGLCSAGLYEEAISLAEKHNDIPSVVASVQSSNSTPEAIEEKNIHFINLFKAEYFDYLLKYLDSHNQNEAILKLCTLYPSHADAFFSHNELKISWIYYLRQKKYKTSLASLKIVVEKEMIVKELLDKLAWTKIILVAASPNSCESPKESLDLKKLDTDIDFQTTQLNMIQKFKDHLDFTTEDSVEDKVSFIFSRCASILYNSGREVEIQEMSQSIASLLDGISIGKMNVVMLLVMLDNVGSDVENVWTAINLVNQLRLVQDESWEALLNMIWKEVYIRDLNGCRYLQIMNDNQYTEIQKNVALQETFLYRVMNICKIKNVMADEILRPSSLDFTNIDTTLAQQIRSLESCAYFINVLSFIDGKQQLTYEDLEDSLKRNTM